MKNFETLLEKTTFELGRECLPAFEQEHGWQVPTPDVAFLRGHRCAGWRVQIRICSHGIEPSF
jgi:hypothetical protein